MAGALALVGLVLGGRSLIGSDGDGGDGGARADAVTAAPSETTAPATATSSVQASAPTDTTSTTGAVPVTPPTDAIELTPEEAVTIEPQENPLGPPAAGTVTLLDVHTEGALVLVTVQLDGTSYEVAAGDTFAPGFSIESIDGSCAQFRKFSTPFALCEGQSTVV